MYFLCFNACIPNYWSAFTNLTMSLQEGQTLQENFFGKLAPIPRDEYKEIYDQTGIDIDGRRAIYLQLISNFDAYMKRYSSFIVAIPGFKKLPVDDQLSLVKGQIII